MKRLNWLLPILILACTAAACSPAAMSIRSFDSELPKIGERSWAKFNPAQVHLYRADGESIL